jgi:hypothetical protein
MTWDCSVFHREIAVDAVFYAAKLYRELFLVNLSSSGEKKP